MARYLFVGERPSPTAARMGVSWRDGRLAAKQLFDALTAAGIDPLSHAFDNLFVHDRDAVSRTAVRRIRAAAASGSVVVALGSKVGRHLTRLKVPMLSMVHPAARGRIRKKERYAEHVRAVLTVN